MKYLRDLNMMKIIFEIVNDNCLCFLYINKSVYLYILNNDQSENFTRKITNKFSAKQLNLYRVRKIIVALIRVLITGEL